MTADTARSRSRRRSAAAVAVAAGSAIILPLLAGTGAAQEARTVEMTLLDQTFTVGGGDTVSMSFAVSDGLPANVLPTTTTTTTTTLPGRPGRTTRQGRPTTTAPASTTTTTTAPPLPSVIGDVRVVAFPPISRRSQIAEVLAGDVTGEPIDGVLVPDLATQMTRRRKGGPLRLDVNVPVAAGDESGKDDLALIEPGIYPVRVAIYVDGAAVAEHTTLVRRVAPVSPPGPRLALVAGALGDDPGEQLDAITELARTEPPLSVIIPPDVLTDFARSAPRALDRLAEALSGDEAVSLPTDAMDPSSAAASGLDDVYIDALSDGEDTLISLLPETPPRRTTSPLVDDVSVGGAELMSQLGLRIFVTDTAYAGGHVEPPFMPPPGEQIAVPLDEHEVGALVVDDDAARLLDPPPGVSPLQTAVELLATLTLDEPDPDGRGMLLATEGFGVPDRAVVRALARLVGETDDVEFVTLSSLPGYSEIAGVRELLLPAEAGTDLSARVTMIEDAGGRLFDTASMLPAGDPRPARWMEELDSLLTTSIDDETATATLDALDAESEAIREAIVPPDPFTFTLTGRNSEVRLRIGNTSDTVLRVKVVPTSSKLTFPDGPQIVDVPPGPPTLVTVRVSARSNGTSSVAMSLRTPADGELTPPVVLTAKVNALTGLSQVITGGAVLVLATWWLHHFRQRRRERRGLPTRRPAPVPET